MSINKTVNTLIDGLAGIIILTVGYQYYIGTDPAFDSGGAVLAVLALTALAGWFIKAITGPITRAIDNTMNKEA